MLELNVLPASAAEMYALAPCDWRQFNSAEEGERAFMAGTRDSF